MKINIDEEGLELLQRTDEPEPERKTHVIDKKPDWYKRGTARLKKEEKTKDRILLPTNSSDGLGTAIAWFIIPLTYIVICSALEMAGWDMRGVAMLTLAIVVGVGTWLYNYILAFPEDINAVVWRVGLFTLALVLGVILVAFL